LIPNSVATVLSFLLLLAPGITWQLLRERHLPSVKETTLVEASRVVLSSLMATGVAGLVLAHWLWLPLYRDFTALATPTVRGSSIQVVAAVFANTLLACALVLGVAALVWPGRAPVERMRVWNLALAKWPADHDAPPYLLVELTDGTAWKGELLAFDSDPEDGHRNVALGASLRVRPVGEQKFKRVAEKGRVVLLPESQVRTMQVVYMTTPAAPVGSS
jgi:hypothetical protein